MLPRSTWMAHAGDRGGDPRPLRRGPNGTIYASTAMLGVCYGMRLLVMVPTASELFGLKHFGMIYNFVLLGNPSAPSSAPPARVPCTTRRPLGRAGGTTRPDRFRPTFALAGTCVLGCVLSVVLTVGRGRLPHAVRRRLLPPGPRLRCISRARIPSASCGRRFNSNYFHVSASQVVPLPISPSTPSS
ncbi:hypothetical protein HPP92_023803 [Vanilla planifolia]|uniref:Uncharacterized protein n=1 Tax=Vanilla planifolia TaxID=51239 RepID=A0A835UCP4_VANPL|nr:hypothetical protein HPP92_023803 [Vanilla planifolia]